MEKVARWFSLKTAANGRIRFFFLLLAILLVAAFLRLYRIDEYMTFLGDEGRDVLVVYDILHGKLTLLGPTASVGGFFLGPIYYYFMVPFLWLFNYNPIGPAVMVALFGVATVWLVYKVGNEFFGKAAGFIGAVLYAISPLIIVYSRSSWNPNLMPFFSLLSLYLLYRAINSRNTLLFITCGFLLGIAIQLHYLTIFLAVIVALYVLVEIPQKSFLLKSYATIFLGFLIGWVPFLAFEARHGFPNTKSIVTFVFASGNTGGNVHFFSVVGDVFFRLFGRLITKFPPPEQVSLQTHTDIAFWYYATLALAIFSTVVFVSAWYKMLRQKSLDFSKYNLLFLWLFLGIGLFGFYKKSIYDYYFGFMFPLPFLLVGNALSFLWTKKGVFGVVSFVAFATLTLLNLTGIPFRFSPNRQLTQVREIAEFVLAKTEGKSFNFALITGGNSDHAYRYFFKLAKRDPVTIQNPTVDPERKTVTEQLLVICETSSCAPLGHPVWEVAGFGRAQVVATFSVSVVKVYKLVPYKQK